MKTIWISGLLATGALFGAVSVSAQEMARVISSTPIVQQVAVPQQVCNTQQVATPGAKTGAGALMGAVAGGAVGNQVGGGGGRAVATIVGVLGGAMLGNSIEGSSPPQVQNVQNCSTQTRYENRTVAYHVSYEYAGRQYSVQMPNDPGQYLPVQVSPIINGHANYSGSYAPGTAQTQPVTAPANVAPSPVYYQNQTP